MSIFVIGINHKTASVEIREKAYFALDRLGLYLQDLMNRRLAQEAVLISTCNRSELYCESADVDLVRQWFGEQTTLPQAELEPLLYTYTDVEAVSHLMQVAVGLDSMIMGEPQILGQLKEAFSESCTAGAVGSMFHRLFQTVFQTAKEIRTTTAIGACPVSVASAAVNFVDRFIPLAKAHVALIGAGDTTDLLLRYLHTRLDKPVRLINRSIEKAEELAGRVGGRAYLLSQIAEGIQDADIVISSTGSPQPIVTAALMKSVMKARAGKPILLLDVAVPRDIDPVIANIENVSLYCIDDLKSIIETNRQGREHAALKAHELISIRSVEFINSLKSIDKVTHTIRAYRAQIEDICAFELEKARQQLASGDDPVLVLDNFARAFTKKLLHAPSVNLRQAGEEGRFELLRFAKQLFAIPDPEIERL